MQALVVGEGSVAEQLRSGLSARGWDVAAGSADLARLKMVVFVCPCSQQATDCADMSAEMWAQGCEKPIADALAYLGEYRSALLAAEGHVEFVVPSFAMSGAKGFSAVAAAGEGLRTLAKGAAKQWGKDNLRVNTIALDPQHFVLGEIGEQLSAVMGLATSSGFGHKGDIAGDIATTLDWLTSEDAHFITGATLVLDGGIWMAG